VKVIFVAAPFRAPTPWEVEQNVRRAETLALEVWRLGAAAICPHANTRFFDGSAPDSVWLEGDREILLRCDAVIAAPWEYSEGAQAEVALAHDQKIPVFFSIRSLNLWLQTGEPPA
jgi:hypothetical protein